MKKSTIDFIEQPETFSSEEMNQILGGYTETAGCNCACRFNLRAVNEDKVVKTKLLKKTKKGLCFIVNVEEPKPVKKPLEKEKVDLPGQTPL